MDPKFWLLATSLLKSVLSKDVANSQHFPLPHMPMEMDQKYQLIGLILAVFCILYVQYSYWHIPNAITKWAFPENFMEFFFNNLCFNTIEKEYVSQLPFFMQFPFGIFKFLLWSQEKFYFSIRTIKQPTQVEYFRLYHNTSVRCWMWTFLLKVFLLRCINELFPLLISSRIWKCKI